MTQPLTPAQLRHHLRRAVALLDDARLMADEREWVIANDAFLADLRSALGVSRTMEAIDALTPKPKYRNHKAERAARDARVVAAAIGSDDGFGRWAISEGIEHSLGERVADSGLVLFIPMDADILEALEP